MHYKNKRGAMNGDTVIGKPPYGVAVIVGIIQDINPGCTSCNATVIRPGGIVQNCVTVGDFFHAEDALACVEAEWSKSVAAMTPPPVDNDHVAEGCEKFTDTVVVPAPFAGQPLPSIEVEPAPAPISPSASEPATQKDTGTSAPTITS